MLGALGFGVVWGCFPAWSSPGSAPGSWLGQQLPLPESSSLPGSGKNRVNKAGLAPGGGTPRQGGHPKTGGDTPWRPGTAEWGTRGFGGQRAQEVQGLEVQGLGVRRPPRRVQECRIGVSRSAQIRGRAGFRGDCTPGGCRDPKRGCRVRGCRDPRRIRGCRGTGKVRGDRVWGCQDPRRVQGHRYRGDIVTGGCRTPGGGGTPLCPSCGGVWGAPPGGVARAGGHPSHLPPPPKDLTC